MSDPASDMVEDEDSSSHASNSSSELVMNDEYDHSEHVEEQQDEQHASQQAVVAFKPPNELAWDARVEELLEYKERNGDCDVPNTFEENPSLARWVGDQRRLYRRGTMAHHRIDRLNEIGFLWSKDRKAPWEVKWDKRFEELQNYMFKYGQIGVTLNGNVHPQWHALNEWATMQRKRYKENKLRQDLVDRLNSVNFMWDTENFLWEKNFALLQKVQKNQANPDDVTAFRRWVSKQRELYHEGTLSPERRDRLSQVSFHWGDSNEGSTALVAGYEEEASNTLRWEDYFKVLVKYKRENGDCHVPAEYRKNPSLAAWCKDMRTMYRKKELAADRVQKLKDLGFRWAHRKTGPKASWEERFEQLCEMLKVHQGMEGLLQYAAAAETLRSKCDEPSSLETIISWVDYQRVLRKHNKLDQDKIDRLTAVGLVWDAHQAAWDARFKQLLQYTQHNVKPRDFASYVKWEHRQRREYRLGTLNQDRIDRLNSTGFRWEPRPQRRRSGQSLASASPSVLSDNNHPQLSQPKNQTSNNDATAVFGSSDAEDEGSVAAISLSSLDDSNRGVKRKNSFVCVGSSATSHHHPLTATCIPNIKHFKAAAAYDDHQEQVDDEDYVDEHDQEV